MLIFSYIKPSIITLKKKKKKDIANYYPGITFV